MSENVVVTFTDLKSRLHEVEKCLDQYKKVSYIGILITALYHTVSVLA